MEYLVDSNVLIDYVANRFTATQLTYLDDIFDKLLIISIISKIEILGFNSKTDEELKMTMLISNAKILILTTQIATTTIQLKKRIKMKTPDAIIAATALEANLTLITNNIADFKNVKGLNIFDPYKSVAV